MDMKLRQLLENVAVVKATADLDTAITEVV